MSLKLLRGKLCIVNSNIKINSINTIPKVLGLKYPFELKSITAWYAHFNWVPYCNDKVQYIWSVHKPWVKHEKGS